MTVAELFGCAFLAFGPPLSMIIFTIAHDPIRIIILIGAAFMWLLSLLLSSVVWFAMIPLREYIAFGLVCSVLIQEGARYLLYRLLRATEKGLEEVANNARVTENKHILAYASGLGFGVVSGAFALGNILADAAGPGTMGLKSGTDMFFLTSAAQTLCMILLHTFWNVIFFNGFDNSRYSHISYVVLSHLFVSCITLLNRYEYYFITLTVSYLITFLTGIFSFRVAGGSFITFKRFITCK